MADHRLALRPVRFRILPEPSRQDGSPGAGDKLMPRSLNGSTALVRDLKSIAARVVVIAGDQQPPEFMRWPCHESGAGQRWQDGGLHDPVEANPWIN